MTDRRQVKQSPFDWLLSPCAIITGVLAGVGIGLFGKSIVAHIAPFGQLYLALLQMCVLPIMITAVTAGLANLLKSEEASLYLTRLLVVFVCGLLVAASIGVALGLIGKPGVGLARDSRVTLGKILTESESGSEFAPSLEISSSDHREEKPSGILSFFINMVPSNIFSALSQGQNLKILFFSLVAGIALGLAPSRLGDNLIDDLDVIFKAFERVVRWSMYGLPFALCSLLASHIVGMGVEIVFAMIKFVTLIYIGSLILVIINGFIMQRVAGGSFFDSFRVLKDAIIIALGARNSFAAMPSALQGLQEGLGLDQQTTNLIVPLGITLCRYGTVMTFALSTVFFSQLYGTPLGLQNLIVTLIGCVLAGMAAAGAPGTVTLSLLALVFNPLGLPLEAAIVLLIAVDPITDPILTLVNVHTNCAATTLVVGCRSKGGEGGASTVGGQ